MNVTRALAEIKSLDSRIGASLASLTYVAVRKNQQLLIAGTSIAEYETGLKANHQSVKDLIERRHKIKRAVVLSNAVTMVEIGGVKMTVAEAIDLKNTISLDESFLKAMKNQYSQAVNLITSTTQKVDLAAEQEANSQFGTKQKSDSAEYAKFVSDYKDRNNVVLVDPNNLALSIKALEEKIETFKTEVDFVLSESNALTQIEI